MQPESPLAINELMDAIFSFKINKSSGYDDINLNVVMNCFTETLIAYIEFGSGKKNLPR